VTIENLAEVIDSSGDDLSRASLEKIAIVD
jgi:hypothetical protein